jgi:GST-like protein
MLTAVYVTGGPNPRKITIFLEVVGLPYTCKVVDVYSGERLSPEFLSVNPNGRLPALQDTEGPDGNLVIWESGAILQYLAEKPGSFSLRREPPVTRLTASTQTNPAPM